MRRIAMLVAWSALFVVLSGASECAHNRYRIEMKPQGDALVRSLEVTRADSDDKAVPAEVLARLAKAYPAEGARVEGDSHLYTGTFSGALPADVGGSGTYRHLVSKLGRAGFYAERFGGRPDLGVAAQQRLAAADRLADLLLGWTRWTLGEQEGFARLEAFIDRRLRADLKDLLFYAATAILLDDYAEGAEKEIGVRVTQRLVERGYFTADEVPRLVVAFARDDAAEAKERTHTMAFVRRKIAAELGRPADQAPPAALDFLRTPDDAHASLLAYVKTTAAFHRLAATKKDAKPQDALDELFEDLVPFGLLGSPDDLELQLACPLAPYATNGAWDAGAKRVAWKQAALRGEPRLPTFAYALWAEPDAAYQQARFGKPALTGQALAEVIGWRCGLSADEAAQWDAFLGGLAPGKDLAKKLGAFRFKGEPAGRDSLADFATRRILQGLDLAPASVPGGTAEGRPPREKGR